MSMNDESDLLKNIYFWLCWVFVAAWALVVASGGYSLVAVDRFLIAVTSLIVERRLQGALASVVTAPGL